MRQQHSGWIRTIRLQQNMQGKQLAEKMKVSPARISVLEKDEQRGAVTLKMMQKAAEALGCRFVYALVPQNGSQAKPKIRLDSSHMAQAKNRQVEELEQAYGRQLLNTTQG